MATHRSRNSALDVALSIGQSAAEITAQFAPCPGLGLAVDLLCGIIQVCDQITMNRNAARQLRDRCYLLLLAVRDDNFSGESVAAAAEWARQTLESVNLRMTIWARQKRFEAFLNTRTVADDIRRCQNEVTACYERLQLSSHSEIQRWQTEFKSNQDRDHSEILDRLSEIQVSMFQEFSALDERVMYLMTIMQENIPNYAVDDKRKNDMEENLRCLQNQSGGLLPEPNLKRGEVKKMDPMPLKRLPVYDLYEGLYLGQQKVWMKQLRAVNAGPKTLERFYREAKIWGSVWARDQADWNKDGTIRRILPFLGFCQDGPGYQYFVSSWQANGTAKEYLTAHPKLDRLKLVRGIAQGLLLLHTMDTPVVHGDLNATSVIIDDWGNPLLSDFGISKVVEDVVGSAIYTQSEGVQDSVRWFAPEVNHDRVLSTRSDVYSFGMTVLELISGRRPYDELRNAFQVVAKVTMGKRPERPAEMNNDKLWALLIRCWDQIPEERPSIQQVVVALESIRSS